MSDSVTATTEFSSSHWCISLMLVKYTLMSPLLRSSFPKAKYSTMYTFREKTSVMNDELFYDGG